MKLHYLFIFALLIATFNVNAQYKRKGETLTNPRNQTANAIAKPAANINVQLLVGKWVEVKRTEKTNNKEQPFTDSTKIYFLDAEHLQYREGKAVRLDADYSVEGDQLFISVQDFTIKSLSENRLVLDDKDDYLREFAKEGSSAKVKVGNDSVKTNTPATTSLHKWEGAWFVYKKNMKPWMLNADEFLIRSINVFDIANDTASLNIVYYNCDTTYHATGKLKALPNGVLIEVPGFNEEVSLFAQDEKELIFGKIEQLIYYCRPVRAQFTSAF